MKLPRRQFLHLATGAAALPAVSRIAWAQTYPTRPVRIIAGFPPGSASDVTARLLGQWLSERLGQAFIVENRLGAASNLAAEAVVRALPDGHTLLLITSVNAVNATLYENLNFDLTHDIAPIASIGRGPGIMVVNPTFEAQSVPEFIAYAKANSGKINVGTAGSGSMLDVYGELFMMMAGVDMVRVPYRGAPPALTDLIGGRVQVVFDTFAASIELIRAGKLRALAVTTATRSAALPVVGFMRVGSPDNSVGYVAAFRKGLNESGYVEGQNVTVEYHWLAGYDQIQALVADLVRRQVAVIATPGTTMAALAAKAATATIPIVFGTGDDSVQLGLVASLARPGGNATGINFFVNEVVAKRLRLLHDLVPKAVHVAVIVDPANAATAEPTVRGVQEAAPTLGLQIQILNASTTAEINAAFAALAHDRPDALFVSASAFFLDRRVQFATLTARHGIPATYSARDYVAAGGLMSYGTDLADMFHRVRVYIGRVLKGEKPADLPVLQSTKFEFVINLQTARELGIEVRPDVLSIADEVIE